MNCPKCTVANPDDKKYCGDCGTLLNPNLTLITPEGRALLKALLKEEFKDRELVEHQVAQAVWDIFYKRIQIATYWGTAVLFIVSTFIGYIGWHNSDINKILSEAETKAKEANAVAEDINKKVKDFSNEVQKNLGNSQQALTDAKKNIQEYETVKVNFDEKTKEYLQVIKRFAKEAPGLATKVAQEETDPLIKDAIQVITQTAQADKSKVDTLPTVFVQFKGDIQRSVVKGFRDELNQKQLPAPGEERIPGTYTNEVRYFDPGDAATAQTVASLASNYFKGKNCSPSDFQVKLIPSPSGQKNLKGQVEVWISGSCKGT